MTAGSDLTGAANSLAAYPEQAIRTAVAGFRDAITPKLRRDTGGDQRLSGLGNAKLNVSSRVTGGGSFVAATVAAGPRKLTGPWRWLNDGVRPYITSAGNRHPGTRALGTFDDPVTAAAPRVEQDLAAQFQRII